MKFDQRIINEMRRRLSLPCEVTDKEIADRLHKTFMWERVHLYFAIKDLKRAFSDIWKKGLFYELRK